MPGGIREVFIMRRWMIGIYINVLAGYLACAYMTGIIAVFSGGLS
jgi:hypothetical protein